VRRAGTVAAGKPEGLGSESGDHDRVRARRGARTCARVWMGARVAWPGGRRAAGPARGCHGGSVTACVRAGGGGWVASGWEGGWEDG
jgi:hypothetical protein